MEMDTQTYRTSDLALAAYLYCSGVRLVSLDRQNPRRCTFVFVQPDPDLVSNWQNGAATANVLAYANAYSVLKAMIFRQDIP